MNKSKNKNNNQKSHDFFQNGNFYGYLFVLRFHILTYARLLNLSNVIKNVFDLSVVGNGVTWDNQNEKKKIYIYIYIYIVKNVQTNKNFSGFPNISRTNTRNKFNCPRIFINLQSYLKVISYVLNNSFSYTQLSFLFVLQKNSYYVHDDTDAFFLFLLQKDFHIFYVIMY